MKVVMRKVVISRNFNGDALLDGNGNVDPQNGTRPTFETFSDRDIDIMVSVLCNGLSF